MPTQSQLMEEFVSIVSKQVPSHPAHVYLPDIWDLGLQVEEFGKQIKPNVQLTRLESMHVVVGPYALERLAKLHNLHFVFKVLFRALMISTSQTQFPLSLQLIERATEQMGDSLAQSDACKLAWLKEALQNPQFLLSDHQVNSLLETGHFLKDGNQLVLNPLLEISKILGN